MIMLSDILNMKTIPQSGIRKTHGIHDTASLEKVLFP